MGAAGYLAWVREGEASAAAGQPVLVCEGEAVGVGDGALAEEGEGTAEGSSSIAGPEDVSFWNLVETVLRVYLITNCTTRLSKSGDGDSCQRVRESAAKDQDLERRLRTYLFIVHP